MWRWPGESDRGPLPVPTGALQLFQNNRMLYWKNEVLIDVFLSFFFSFLGSFFESLKEQRLVFVGERTDRSSSIKVIFFRNFYFRPMGYHRSAGGLGRLLLYQLWRFHRVATETESKTPPQKNTK